MARKPTASHQDQFYPASQFKRKRSSFRMHILPFLAAWNLRQDHSDTQQNTLTFKKLQNRYGSQMATNGTDGLVEKLIQKRPLCIHSGLYQYFWSLINTVLQKLFLQIWLPSKELIPPKFPNIYNLGTKMYSRASHRKSISPTILWWLSMLPRTPEINFFYNSDAIPDLQARP